MSRTAKRLIGRFFAHLIILFFAAIMIYPVIWMVVSSIKPGNTIFSDPGIIPQSITFEHYVSGWKGVARIHFSLFIINSLILCAAAVTLNVISCSLTSYAFARLKFFLKGFWFAVMMLTLMLPAHVTTIPRYVMFNTFGWLDSQLYLPLLTPKLFATEAFFVFLLVQFMRGIPKDLDESATIDGCGKVGIFIRIILPLSTAALVTTALFTFLWTYDDFFNQLLYINTMQRYTVPLGLRLFLDATGESNWGAMFAMSVVSIMPAFILFFSLQKYFVQGITTTGIKG